eukprot:scaffold39237_cov19-Tisochrysis_lutea.AAC.4
MKLALGGIAQQNLTESYKNQGGGLRFANCIPSVTQRVGAERTTSHVMAFLCNPFSYSAVCTVAGKRGSAIGVTKAKRIEYAREILQKVRMALVQRESSQTDAACVPACAPACRRCCLTWALASSLRPERPSLWATWCTGACSWNQGGAHGTHEWMGGVSQACEWDFKPQLPVVAHDVKDRCRLSIAPPAPTHLHLPAVTNRRSCVDFPLLQKMRGQWQGHQCAGSCQDADHHPWPQVFAGHRQLGAAGPAGIAVRCITGALSTLGACRHAYMVNVCIVHAQQQYAKVAVALSK